MAKEKYELAELDYINGMKYKDLAEKYGVSINTIKSWKQRYKWCKDKKGMHTKNKKACTQNNINKSGAQKENKIKEDSNKEDYLDIDVLTDKQKLFAEIYVINFNATQAAIKAGYSPTSAFVEGCRLLKNDKVKAYVDYLKELKKESILVEIDDIVERQMKIAFANMGDFIEFGRELVPVMNSNGPIVYMSPTTGKEEILMQTINNARLKESWEVDTSLIKEINVTRQGTSIKLYDPQKAMDWLRDFFGENPEHKYKKEFDNKKMQLERERFEYQKERDQEDW